MSTKYITSSDNTYKKYVTLLNQVGTSGPTPSIVLENTLGSIGFSYVLSGEYLITSGGLFTPNKTVVFTQPTLDNVPQTISIIVRYVDANTLELKTLISGIGYTDNFLNLTPIEIRVYN